jgi:putative peptidoglycan lipid II flippase
MGAATFLSRILGLVREQVFAFFFGAGHATDAFNIAFRIPNLFRDLFAEGAMSASLVPTFTRARAEEGDRRAWRLAGLIFRALLVIVGALALLGILFAEPLVSLYASAYRAVPGKFELTVEMTRIIFPFFPLVALAAAFMAVLNACGRFFLPAFASALFNLTSITVGVAGALLFPRWGIEPIVGMAVGVVAGGAVQAFCQLPSLYRVGYRWQPAAPGDPPWHKDPALRRMLALMIPGTIGLAATQINVLVNSVLATSQGPGAVSWLNYAFRLMQFPIGIFGVSLAAATLPRVSRLWVDRDAAGVRETLERSLRHVFAINLPASAGLAFLGPAIVELLFQYGRFGIADTRATAAALAAYAVGLTAYSAVKVLVPACYALGNTRVAVVSSALSVFFTVTLNLLMIRPFGYVGLALATSVAAILNAGFLLASIRGLLRKAGGSFPLLPLVRSFAGHLGAALIMGAATRLAYDAWIQPIPDGDFAPLARSLKVSAGVACGMALTWLIARLAGLDETLEILRMIAEKLKKKLSQRKS